MSEDDLTPLNEAQLRKALEDCTRTGNLAECRALLNRPHSNPRWLADAAFRGVNKATDANDIDMLRAILTEWRSNPASASTDNLLSSRFQWPLIHATQYKNRDMVKLLLEHGACIDSSVTSVFSEQDMQADFESEEVLNILDDFVSNGWAISRVSVHLTESYSVAERSPSYFDWLLAHGASPNVTDFRKQTPLSVCARDLSLSLMQKLFANGAHPDNNALHMAIRSQRDDTERLSMLNLLLDKGPDINALEDPLNSLPPPTGIVKPRVHANPLFLAVSLGNFAVVKLLVERGANVHVRNSTKWLRTSRETLSGLDAMRTSQNANIRELAEEYFGPATEEEIAKRTEVQRSLAPRKLTGEKLKKIQEANKRNAATKKRSAARKR